jgi:hypothetical protein
MFRDEESINRSDRLVPEVLEKIRVYFGADSITTQELLVDPDDGGTELFLVVRTALTEEEALRCLARFDREWWLDIIPSVAGQMNVTIAS